MVCVKEQEDHGEKLSQDEIISQTKQVIQGLEALKQEHHSILEGLLGTLRCLKQDEEGVLVEEKSHMIRKSLEMLELGLSEAQVRTPVRIMCIRCRRENEMFSESLLISSELFKTYEMVPYVSQLFWTHRLCN